MTVTVTGREKFAAASCFQLHWSFLAGRKSLSLWCSIMDGGSIELQKRPVLGRWENSQVLRGFAF